MLFVTIKLKDLLPEFKPVSFLVAIELYAIYALINRCSKCLPRIVSYILKFLKILPVSVAVTVQDLIKSENVLIQIVQQKCFSSERSMRLKDICPHNLKHLRAFLDENNIIRVGGLTQILMENILY